MTTLTLVSSCQTTACSFNDGGCTAYGITVGGSGALAACDTFTALDARAGAQADGAVAACKRLECVHNDKLICSAGQVSIGGDNADCLTYSVN